MNRLRRGVVGVLVACVVAMAAPAAGAVTLPSIIGSNMVLQADAPLPIWGWADPGEKVTVSVAGQGKTATAGADGRWKVVLDKLRTSDKPQKMTVKGADEIVLENVLVGEVWVGSGQSNMQMMVGGSKDGAAEVAAAKYPTMRLFLVPPTVAQAPADDVPGRWVECSPATVGDFSAVLYHFGRRLQSDLKVPVGLFAASGKDYVRPLAPKLDRVRHGGSQLAEKLSQKLSQNAAPGSDRKLVMFTTPSSPAG